MFWSGFEAITAAAPTAREKLLAFFGALQTYTLTPACYGCPFLNVASEYHDPAYPGHQIAVAHKAPCASACVNWRPKRARPGRRRWPTRCTC